MPTMKQLRKISMTEHSVQQEFGVLSFGLCCENNHRDCIGDTSKLQEKHRQFNMMFGEYPDNISRRYYLTPAKTFKPMGILIWGGSCIINDIIIRNCTQFAVQGGISGDIFKSPITFQEVIMLCLDGNIQRYLGSIGMIKIDLPTIEPGMGLELYLTGGIQDIVFWGRRLLE